MNVGIKVIQMDYYTGEFIGEYQSITAAADDNEIDKFALINRLNKFGVTKYKNKKLAFCKFLVEEEPKCRK